MYPLVSVVVPLFNYEKYIAWCIKSILKQDYPNIEIIVIDDCSKDKSFSVAKRYRCDNVRVKRLSKNIGYSAAKNKGVGYAKGKYLVVLDADDMLTKDSISVRVKALMDKKVQFVHADAVAVYDGIDLVSCYRINTKKLKMSDKLRNKRKFSLLHFPSCYDIHAQTVMYERDLHKVFGLYDEDMRSVGDREMWWRFFGQSSKDKTNVPHVHISHCVSYYRYHKRQMSRYRALNKKYNKKIHRLAQSKYKLRKSEGITPKNTRMLM